MRFSGKDYVFYSLLSVPEGFIFFSLFLYSALPNLPSFQICCVLTLTGSSLVTRKQDPSEIPCECGCRQIIFSEYVCACVFIPFIENKHPLALHALPPPTPMLCRRREITKPGGLSGFSTEDQTRGPCSHSPWEGQVICGQLPAEPDSL